MNLVKNVMVILALSLAIISCEKADEQDKVSDVEFKSTSVVIDKNAKVNDINGTLFENENGQKILEISGVTERAEGSDIEWDGVFIYDAHRNMFFCIEHPSYINKNCFNATLKGEDVIILQP